MNKLHDEKINTNNIKKSTKCRLNSILYSKKKRIYHKTIVIEYSTSFLRKDLEIGHSCPNCTPEKQIIIFWD